MKRTHGLYGFCTQRRIALCSETLQPNGHGMPSEGVVQWASNGGTAIEPRAKPEKTPPHAQASAMRVQRGSSLAGDACAFGSRAAKRRCDTKRIPRYRLPCIAGPESCTGRTRCRKWRNRGGCLRCDNGCAPSFKSAFTRQYTVIRAIYAPITADNAHYVKLQQELCQGCKSLQVAANNGIRC